jgi:NAD(P)-dependent dehydrogenase (short-subunit alcohol dehydrogenase family)
MNKTVIVTGADYNHTGFAIARRFAREGYDVVLTCITEELVNEAVTHLESECPVKVKGFVLDLREKEHSIKLFEEGIKLSKSCHDMLEKAEKKVSVLINGEKQEFADMEQN